MVDPAKDDGALGVVHLKRLWQRALERRRLGFAGPDDESEWRWDFTVLRALDVELIDAFRYLYADAPPFDEFERWIVERNGGSIDPARIERINRALTGVPVDDPDAPVEPVLPESDLAFWNEHGYVVVHDAVSPEVRADAEAAVWRHLGMDRDDPESWYHGERAIPPDTWDDPALWAVRRSPRIRNAFAQLWGRNDLALFVLQAGINPPERPGWRFPGQPLHWDMDVVVPFPFGVQGLVYLTDTAENQGALTCIPGFHRRIESWVHSLPAGAHAGSQRLAELGEAVPIAGRAGDLVLWHHGLPHSATPNRAERPRVVQYVKMVPRRWD